MGRAFEKRKSTIFRRMDRVSKQFAKIAKDIAISIKGGGSSNPDANPTLRRAIVNARAVNMPKDKIDAAIKKASGEGGANYEEIIYEGYAPHGIAVVVEAATDNVTRTAANVRATFKFKGGNLGTTGSVAFMFSRQGIIRISPEGVDRDALELDLIDHGLLTLEEGEGEKGEKLLEIRTAYTDWGSMQTVLEARKIPVISTTSEYVPATTTELPEDKVDDVLKMVAALEDDDDVTNVYTNLA
jgi:YebC/PmpR family DNA-binding regulatory protein